jgi:hypothetical protein
VSLTIDANVWLAAADPRDPSQDIRLRFLDVALGSDETLESPLLLEVELVGATARKTGDSAYARRLLHEIANSTRTDGMPSMRI